MVLERALYFVFDYSLWRDWLEGRKVRAPIAYVVSLVICVYHDFDIISAVLDPEITTYLGIAVTAGIVAGGSQAAIVLFQDVLNLGRQQRARMKALKEKELSAREAIAEREING